MVDIVKIESPVKPTTVISKINELIDYKQDTLVSGTNIKTINNNSILGSGNISIEADVEAYTASEVQTLWDNTSASDNQSNSSNNENNSSSDSSGPGQSIVNDELDPDEDDNDQIWP